MLAAPTPSHRPRHPWRSLLVSGAITLATARAHATDIQVFTDQQHSVRAVSGARITELDTPAQLESMLATQLPSDPTRAAMIVHQRLEAGGAALQRRLAEAYQGVIDAWQLGVVKLPAVVVEGRWVVYGDSDIADAVARINAYRSAHP